MVQAQVFFSIALAILFYRDRPSRWQIVGVSVGTLGIAAVGADVGQTMPLLAFMVTLCAALCWAVGNTFVKAMGPVNAISLVVWASLIAAATLIPASLLIEGTAPWSVAFMLLAQGDLVFWGSLLFNGFGASLLGYGGWSWLLRRHSTALVAPFTMLVPVFGLGIGRCHFGRRAAARQLAWNCHGLCRPRPESGKRPTVMGPFLK